MKKILIALLAVATVGWYAQTADAAPHRGYRSSGHHGSHHAPHRSHSYHGGHHHYGHHYYHHGPYYRPDVRRYYVEPAPYNGIELYGERGGFSLFW